MTIPRIARIHLVYQFIILTLIVFAIGYNEILPDKKYLFLALIPVFGYQLMIVFCGTELLPLPSWIDVQEYARGSTKDDDTLIETKGPSVENLESLPPPVKSSESIFPKKLSSFKYTLKNRKTEIPSNNKVSESQEINALGSEVLNNTEVSEANSRHLKLETTKSYYFPYRQKRSEEWIEQKKTVRPYKVRNVKSDYGDKTSMSPIHLSPLQIRQEEEKKSSIPTESENEYQINENEPTDLKKSYSFPFRQKKLEKFLVCEENLEDSLNIQIMPPWKALNYRSSVNNCEGRRKSISTEALHEEMELIKSSCQQEKNDFTQSMEVTRTFNSDACAIKKNPLKSTTSFNKFKQGVVNYFYKNKRESFKTDETKQNDENRKQFFRELFLSKESLNFDSIEKTESATQVKVIKPENRSELGELFQPSYVSYASDSFTNDVKVYSHPKNFKK